MKTATLRRLVTSLGEARHEHLSRALLEPDPLRRSRARAQACRVETVLDAVRKELVTRDTHSRRTPTDMQHAEHCLTQLLADLLELDRFDVPRAHADPAARTGAEPARARPAQAQSGAATAEAP